ncbi:MAG: hypothetical protein AAGG09_01545 [Pseudomonadota bacterium]
MRHLIPIIRRRALGALLACFGVLPAFAEPLVSMIADTRTLAAFRVNPEALAGWLPETHQPAPYASGSFEGAKSRPTPSPIPSRA